MEENLNNLTEQAAENQGLVIAQPVVVSSLLRKNWISYVKEFLLLFLAVFAGFLAENYRDRLSEEARAKELAFSFYEELKNDSVTLEIKTQNRIKQEKALRYLMLYFEDSALTDVSKTFAVNFVIGISFRTPSLFEPRTVILDQLKNSGSLRYFKSKELQNLVGDLSVAIHNINDRQRLETEIRKEYIQPLMIRHYDYDFHAILTENEVDVFQAMARYEQSKDIIPFEFKVLEKFDKNGTINALGFYGMNALLSTRSVHFKKYKELNTKLLQLLRKEFKIVS
jgi:hypothetical protein